MINLYKILVGRPERKRLLGRPRRRWENDIRMDLREIRWKVVDWVHLAQDRHQRWVVNKGMNLGVSKNLENFLTVIVSFPRTLLHGVS
jgi:hypothetical protein